MITIIAAIYIFYLMWYFINSWKLVSENPQDHPPPDKSHPPIFTQCPLKVQKVQVTPFPTSKLFQAPLQKAGILGSIEVFFVK